MEGVADGLASRGLGKGEVMERCNHFCHDEDHGLNPWVKQCPVCGCENPKFDPAAVSDIRMPSISDMLRDLFN